MKMLSPPAPAALGIILTKDQTAILLVKRHDVPVWVLPGGGIDPPESPEEAVIREIEEETGFQVTILRKSAEYSPINRLSAFTSVFICNIQSGSVQLSAETQAIEFFPLNKLPKTFFFLHALWLDEILHSPGLISRPLKEISYSALFLYLVQHPWTVLRFAWTRLYS